MNMRMYSSFNLPKLVFFLHLNVIQIFGIEVKSQKLKFGLSWLSLSCGGKCLTCASPYGRVLSFVPYHTITTLHLNHDFIFIYRHFIQGILMFHVFNNQVLTKVSMSIILSVDYKPLDQQVQNTQKQQQQQAATTGK